MYQFKGLDDTIAAISTPLGEGGIGIVRLSGPLALAIADEMFAGKSALKPSQFKNYTVHYGKIVRRTRAQRNFLNGGEEIREEIDEVILTVMRGPKSYTAEDVVEISCHGGMVPLKAILTLAVDLGARLAEPGEFTKRAFLNGRIDLTQAEAVLDMIQARTEAFLKVSHQQLKGELSSELESIREALIAVYTEIEAAVNFPEDEIDAFDGAQAPPFKAGTGGAAQSHPERSPAIYGGDSRRVDAGARKEIFEKITSAHERVNRLLRSSDQGRILREGIKIVLCGKPNVGKSSLLNVLLRQPRAIVSQIPGTTRDTIEETAQIKGIPFQLVDTAGVLEPHDLVEAEAVERSRLSMQGADLILFVVDSSEPLSVEDKQVISNILGRNILVVANKCDLPPALPEEEIQHICPKKSVIKISALKKTGIEELENAIVESVWEGSVTTEGILVSNARHIESLKNSQENLAKARQIMEEGISLEFVSEEIKSAVNALDAITGRNIDADLLEKIFSQFCIGK